jgi:hypothetical protein
MRFDVPLAAARTAASAVVIAPPDVAEDAHAIANSADVGFRNPLGAVDVVVGKAIHAAQDTPVRWCRDRRVLVPADGCHRRTFSRDWSEGVVAYSIASAQSRKCQPSPRG